MTDGSMIYGSAEIGGRDQKDIKVFGTAQFSDAVKKRNIEINGLARFNEAVEAENIKVRGTIVCDGALLFKNADVSGNFRICSEGLKCKQMNVSGMLSCAGNIKAEEVTITGEANVGTMSADRIKISGFDGRLLGKVFSQKHNISKFDSIIAGAIEADDLIAERVVCENIVLGDRCHIGLLEYSGKADISSGAEIGNLIVSSKDK